MREGEGEAGVEGVAVGEALGVAVAEVGVLGEGVGLGGEEGVVEGVGVGLSALLTLPPAAKQAPLAPASSAPEVG